jgi:diaminopimelate decarboxylase
MTVRLDGGEAAALAERYGTPLYLYDLDAATAHLLRLRAALPGFVDVYYCVKANPNRAVLEAFRPHVAGSDISSAGELELGVAAGYAAGAMSLAGPGKTDEELRRAVGAGLGLLSLESVAELARAARAAAALGRRQPVTVRINPAATPRGFAMRMGGGASQFGVAEEDAPAALDAVLAEPRVKLCGLHVYAGTQCLEPGAILDGARATLAIVRRLTASHDLSPAVVNLGGGFGIPYFEGQEGLALEPLARDLGALLVAAREAEPRLAATRFVLELGRYLIGPFGVYVTRVTEVKKTRGKRFVILDGGMHHCFPATGNFGQLVKKNYPVANLSRGGGASEPQELCGPLCTPLDSMARAAPMPRAEPGDLIGIFSCGAYALSASPVLFLGHDTPAELIRSGGAVAVGRSRVRARDLYGLATPRPEKEPRRDER